MIDVPIRSAHVSGRSPRQSRLGWGGTGNALSIDMELLGRLFAALGISLVLTLVLLVLYQDDPQAQMPGATTAAVAISQQTSVATAAVDTP